MEEDALLPLGNATASDIRDIKQPGFVRPVRDQDRPLLITRWNDAMYGMTLDGEGSFCYFQVTLRYPHMGLFVHEPEILVDYSSATEGGAVQDRRGLLILSVNCLAVVASKAGDNFVDPQVVPLWKTVAGGSEAARIAFTHWAIGIRHGERYQVLWERREPVRSFYQGLDD